MEIFSFTIYCKEEDITQEQASALHDVCLLCGVSYGKVYVAFETRGTFKEPVYEEAREQVKKVGLTPISIVEDE